MDKGNEKYSDYCCQSVFYISFNLDGYDRLASVDYR